MHSIRFLGEPKVNLLSKIWTLAALLFSAHAHPAACPLPLVKLATTQLTEIRLVPSVSAEGRRNLLKTLKAKGFVPILQAPGEPLFGMLPETVLREVSQLRGVERIVRTDDTSTQTWKQGQRRWRGTEYPQDDPENIWTEMPGPVKGTPPRDLASLRKLAREKGVIFVLPILRPNDPGVVAGMEALYGGRIFFSNDLPAGDGIVRLEGVALHIGPDARSLRVRGEMNPMIGHGSLHGQMNKIAESEWIHSIGPNFMAAGHATGAFWAGPNGEAIAALQKAALDATNAYLKGKGKKAEAVKAVTTFLDRLHAEGSSEFPQGFFLKGKDDYATREAEALVTDSTPPSKLAEDFIADVARIKSLHGSPRLKLASPAAQEYLFVESEFPVGMVGRLLEHPEDVLIQQKLPIKRTARNNLMEFRVDVIQGHVTNSSFRYGQEYFPRESKGAADFVAGFIKQVKGPPKYLSASMDVAMLQDGTYRIIETNTGTDGASVDPALYSYEANVSYSNLLGHQTPLLTRWNKVYREGADAQAAELRKHKANEGKAVSPKTVTADNFMLFLREKYAEQWRKSPNWSSFHRVHNDFMRVLQAAGHGGSWKAQLSHQTLVEYMQREMSRPVTD